MLPLAAGWLAAPSSQVLLPAASPLVCVSKVADVKSVTCNVQCNSQQHACPEACYCMPPTSPSSMDLSPGLASEDFTRLMDMLERKQGISLTQKSKGERKECVSINSGVRDGWCTRNCNNDPPDCPENLCSCDGSTESQGKIADKSKLKSTEMEVPFTPAILPEEVAGFYMKSWSCTGDAKTNLNVWDCAGPAPIKNVNVWFSGLGSLGAALTDSGVLAGQAGGCLGKDEAYCERQVKASMPWGADKLTGEEAAQARDKAIAQVLGPGNWNAARCMACLDKKGPPTKKDKIAAARPYPPFTTDLAFRQGVQFVSLGGAGGPGTITVAKLKRFTDEDGAQTVKNAGFHGVCFDIELTTGEEDLVEAMEKTFRILKKAGLLVMVTTSHSAPYAASSERAKNLIVESWVQSKDIDIFSPQLYTSGSESAPELEATHCSGALAGTNTAESQPKGATALFDDKKRAEREAERLKSEREGIAGSPAWNLKHPSNCTYERLKPMKAMWVPSIVSESQYPATREFFASKGITTKGYIQWK